MDTKDYEDLYSTGHKGYKAIPPEEEFFKSVYIGGNDRKNHINVIEKAGKLHIRGFAYNLERVPILITHVKNVLVKTRRDEKQGKDITDCFSYQNEAKNKGTSGRECGTNSAERAAVDFCKDCRSNLIVSGIYCDENGKPFVDDRGQLVRTFIRAKGMKYTNVRGYLDKLATQDIDPPFFSDQSAKAKDMERTLINNKRFVTIITIGTASTKSYGDKKVFVLDSGTKVSREITEAVLKDAKASIKDFNEKFDWSTKNKAATGYGDSDDSEKEKPGNDQTFESPLGAVGPSSSPEKVPEPEKQKAAPQGSKIPNFEDIAF